MKTIFAIAACLAVALGAMPAAAQQCSRGQIFWKSKKTCIDKAEAAKLGFYHGPLPKASDQPEEADLPEPPAAAPETAAAEPAAPPPPEAPPAPPPPSPFGELVLEEFAAAR